MPVPIEVLKSRFSPKTRDSANAVRVVLRRPTAGLRALPDALIIGGQRCGTSSLYKYLGAHPWVVPSVRKETHYFSSLYANGPEWYRAHFPLRARSQAALAVGRGIRMTFEASPRYLVDGRAAARAAALVPGAKIIVLLRDPVARAFSHHQKSLRAGRESIAFDESMQRALEVVDSLSPDDIQQLLGSDDADMARRRALFLVRGMYAHQLEFWLHYYPRDQFFIARSEDFFSRTEEVYLELLSFLGLPPWRPHRFRNYSAAGREPSAGATMSAETSVRLREYFAPHNKQLYDLLGRDLAWPSPEPQTHHEGPHID